MIFKLRFEDDRIEWCQAKNTLHLLQSYDEEYDGFHEIIEVTEISQEEAEAIMIKNTDYDETDPTDRAEWPLSDVIVGDDFCIVASTEWS